MQAFPKQRVVWAFARTSSNAETLAKLAADMDDESLRWAYVLPEHTDAAKAAIAQELEKRGHSAEDVANWIPLSGDFAIPARLGRPIAWSKYVAAGRRRVLLFRLYRAIVIFAVAFLIACAIMQLSSDAAAPVGMPIVLAVFVILLASGWLFGSLRLRILLLRPFGEKRMTAELKRFVRNMIGPLGFIYTLSDRAYRPANPILVFAFAAVSDFLVIMLNAIMLTSLRFGSVKNCRSFRGLQKKIAKANHRWRIFAFQCGFQAFNVRSTDPWWKLCILMFLSCCDVVIVDLSKVKEGTAWELQRLRDTADTSRCVFVVSDDQQQNLDAIFEEHFSGNARPHVFVYEKRGTVASPEQFWVAIEEAATRSAQFEQAMTPVAVRAV